MKGTDQEIAEQMEPTSTFSNAADEPPPTRAERRALIRRAQANTDRKDNPPLLASDFAAAFIAELNRRPGRPPTMKRIARRLNCSPLDFNAGATQLRRNLLHRFDFHLIEGRYVHGSTVEVESGR